MSAHETLGIAGGLYRPLSDPDVQKVVDGAFRVLAESGMAVYSEQARDALKSAGAEVDESSSLVKMSRSFVEDAIASNPSSITLYSRDGQNDCVLEGSRVHYGTGGTALYVLDPDTGQRCPARKFLRKD